MFKPYLKLAGFKFKKPMFYCAQKGNFGMIVFQKSMASNKFEISFTVNIGVSSKAIFDYMQSNLIEFKKPSFKDVCWSERLGFLTKYKEDLWWSLQKNTDIQLLFSELQDYIINLAVPEIKKYIDNDGLIRKFSESDESHNLIKLGILLKSEKRFSELETVINKLEKLMLSSKYKAGINSAINDLRNFK